MGGVGRNLSQNTWLALSLSTMGPTVDQATEYIISQTKNNIQFLQSINRISSEDARQILSKLPAPDCNDVVARQNNSSRSPSPYGTRVGTNIPPVLPRPIASNYRALWSWNENGQVNFDWLVSFHNILDRLSLNRRPRILPSMQGMSYKSSIRQIQTGGRGG